MLCHQRFKMLWPAFGCEVPLVANSATQEELIGVGTARVRVLSMKSFSIGIGGRLMRQDLESRKGDSRLDDANFWLVVRDKLPDVLEGEFAFWPQDDFTKLEIGCERREVHPGFCRIVLKG